jgi:hypothetical protein
MDDTGWNLGSDAAHYKKWRQEIGIIKLQACVLSEPIEEVSLNAKRKNIIQFRIYNKSPHKITIKKCSFCSFNSVFHKLLGMRRDSSLIFDCQNPIIVGSGEQYVIRFDHPFIIDIICVLSQYKVVYGEIYHTGSKKPSVARLTFR